VEDSEGRRVAQAMGTFRYRDPESK